MFKVATNICAKHAFSTRIGGSSVGEFSELNLGFTYGDAPANVSQNWEVFSIETSISFTHLAAATQVHKADVAIVEANDCISAASYALSTPTACPAKQSVFSENNKHIFKFSPLCNVDGLITAEKDVTLAIFTADCASLVMHDNNARISAALHCGWKSFTSDIIANGIDAMKFLGANTANIQAAIGPCIGKCCFEVGPEVAGAFDNILGRNTQNFYSKSENKNKFYADLAGAVAHRLNQLGVNANNIYNMNECTRCNNKTYFSFRAENGHTGRLVSVIQNF